MFDLTKEVYEAGRGPLAEAGYLRFQPRPSCRVTRRLVLDAFDEAQELAGGPSSLPVDRRFKFLEHLRGTSLPHELLLRHPGHEGRGIFRAQVLAEALRKCFELRGPELLPHLDGLR